MPGAVTSLSSYDSPMPLRLFNTLTRQLEVFVPADPGKVTFYTCGPTVYDDAHIGNFRSFLAADVLRRFIESPLCEVGGAARTGGTGSPVAPGQPVTGGRRVVHVMNITDVGHMTDDEVADGGGEDKMQAAARRLEEAKKSGKLPAGAEGAKIDPRDPYAIAAFYTERFLEDARKLGLKVAIEARKDPTLMPRATANVPGMITMILRLIERGFAYAVGEAGRQTVYFRVQSFPSYGRLSGNTLDKLREGAGGRIGAEAQAEKEHPADFLLWKSDDSHLMKWESPWGAGYPGWHIECSVMSFNRLVLDERRVSHPATPAQPWEFPGGEPLIDLHSGGEDNIFPHHECEIAQSCCALNETPQRGSFARYWFHPRFLLVEGEKMSKRRGNFYTPRDLFARGLEPAAVRLELIKTHYRSNANFTEQGLKDSARMVERWRRFLEQAQASSQQGSITMTVRQAFAEAMHDDLNVAGAIGVLNKWVGEVGEGGATKADGQLLLEFDRVLGLLELERPRAEKMEIGIFAPGVDPNPRVIELLERRRDARAAKDFATSDAIRDELAALGYEIKDVAGGKVEVRRK
jgi:cysteinyl-tRNA synthetase